MAFIADLGCVWLYKKREDKLMWEKYYNTDHSLSKFVGTLAVVSGLTAVSLRSRECFEPPLPHSPDQA